MRLRRYGVRKVLEHYFRHDLVISLLVEFNVDRAVPRLLRPWRVHDGHILALGSHRAHLHIFRLIVRVRLECDFRLLETAVVHLGNETLTSVLYFLL